MYLSAVFPALEDSAFTGQWLLCKFPSRLRMHGHNVHTLLVICMHARWCSEYSRDIAFVYAVNLVP